MSDVVAEVVANFRAETASFLRAMDGVRTKVGNIEKSMNTMGTAVKRATLGFLSFEAVRRSVTAIARETMEAEQSMARLEGVLKATGNVTGHTARELDNLAESLQRATLFKDDDIRSAIAVLATFRSVSGAAFTETIKLATDMSAVFDQSLQSSVTQLGKAMEDPITGLTSLRRIGVSFSTVQRDLIKSLVEENKLFEAQQEILKGVSIQLAGTAEKMGAAGLTGTVNSLSDAWHELLKEVGKQTFADPDTVRELGMLASLLDRIREQYTLFFEGDKQSGLEIQLKRVNEQITKLRTPDDAPGGARSPAPEEMLALGDLQREYDRLHAVREDILDQLKPFVEAEKAAKTVTEQAAVAAKKQADAERERAAVLAGAEEAQKKAMKSLEALSDETARIMENRWDQFIAGLEAAEEAEKDAAEEIVKAQKKAFDQMERNAEALQQADDEFAKAEAAKEWAAGWGHAFEEIQDKFASGFERLLTGQIKTFRDFAQMILQIWAQTLAQMAAAQASAGLMKIGASLLGSFLGRGGGPLGGMVDSPSLPGMGGGGMVASMAGSAGSGGGAVLSVSNHFTIQSLDPRTTAQLIEQQAPTIVGTIVQALDRSSALRQKFAGR